MAFHHWNLHDDFLLRSSIEKGASLESLAKGAIKFSRKFTLSELTDRWYSLLYDPNVKSLSSTIGFDLQYSSQFLPQSIPHQKRVRSRYYTSAARKKIRVEVVEEEAELLNKQMDEAFGGANLQDLDFLDELIEFDESQFEILRLTFPELMQDDQTNNKDRIDGDRILDQFVNINEGLQIHREATTQHDVLIQEEFRELNTITSSSQSHHHQEGTLIVPLSKLDLHPEIKGGVIICTLNLVSDEIPDNRDFNPQLYKPRNSFNPSSLRKPPLPPIRISSSSQLAKGNNDMIFKDCTAATQSSCYSPALKDTSVTWKTTTSTFTTTSSPKNEIREEMFSATEIDMRNVSVFGEEENNNNEVIESDEDLPSFSDVEDMVLDMDLEPVGQDHYEMEAIRYRNEEAMRKIMRLEQSFQAYTNRDIASHEALAILYGSSRHYIHKREVLLGRATGEYQVDIDLGRSGSESKVSRRQALIKLKEDGCFEIKNLGKLSIWMNEKEIEHGEVVNLKNQCLIQIREMSFIFETNEKAIKRYLDRTHR